MRTRQEVSGEKLRGGFYSPDVLVDMCVKRSATILAGRTEIRVLEPSAGDGAFLRGLARSELGPKTKYVEAVEILGGEAKKSTRALASLDLPGKVVHENVLLWSQSAAADFDLLLANPPYVRFQFISDEDKQRARSISSELGTAGSSVSNLWIPVFLLSLTKLRVGGAFSVILPTEFLTGVSASAVRNWLLANTSELTIDLFKPGSFPSVLQEVLILSGRKIRPHEKPSIVQFQDHNGGTRAWSHSITAGAGTWTGYLLSPAQNRALADARSATQIRALGTLARFSVSTVTGANGYFCVNSNTVDNYGLAEWAIPMLPRTRYAKGLIFDSKDEHSLTELGLPAWMISFAADKTSPESRAGRARDYLKLGEAEGIDKRYKCRVRSPWYRVPVVPSGELLLSKRSNRFPRVISNHAGVVTTDTIYRGQMLSGAPITADDFTATFHNSLTMLSAEVEGRSFGGGVLELVPSEVSSLRVPVVPGAAKELKKLDKIARDSEDPEALIEATDKALSRLVPELDLKTLSALRAARMDLTDRRMQRTHTKFYS